MKNLNELIKTLEDILPNPPTESDLESEGYYIQQDVIYYLKEYQTLIKILNQNTELKIGKSTSEYKIELTKPEFESIII